ncbi:AtpZ/AtpI family protein [bacterium]|nr:AtpZ/AtpI family protein [bacterium]
MAKKIVKPGSLGNLAEESSLGWSIAIAVGTGIFVGMWVDNQWEVEPWGLIGGFLWGIGGASRLLIRAQKRLDEK